MSSGGVAKKGQVNPAVFYPPAILLVIAILLGIISPEKFGSWADAALNFTVSHFGWFYNGGTAEAGENALSYTFFHWAFHPYAFYSTAGLCISFMHFNAKRSFKVSSALYPLLGEKSDGLPGNLINALTTFCVVACMGTSLGMGTMQFAGGLNYVLGTTYESTLLWVVIIGGTCFFYITAAPIVGLFLVKLSQGRTVRQFMLMNMLAPSLFTFVWFGIFGSAAIDMKFFQNIKISEEIASKGVDVAMFAMLKNLPLSFVTMAIGLIMIIVSFICMADAMTLSLADMSAGNTEDGQFSPAFLKIFWGGLMGLLALALLLSGGLKALQTSVIVCGVPILMVIVAMAAAFIKAFYNRDKYDLVNPSSGR